MSSRQQLVTVAGVGAAGGVLAWLFRAWTSQAANLGPVADLAVSVPLGAGAGIVFVFLIANTDRADHARLIALALVAGVFWEPVWFGARAVVGAAEEKRSVVNGIAAVERALEIARSYDSATEEEKRALLDEFATTIMTASSMTARLSTVASIEQVRAAAAPLESELMQFPMEQRLAIASPLRTLGIEPERSPILNIAALMDALPRANGERPETQPRDPQ